MVINKRGPNEQRVVCRANLHDAIHETFLIRIASAATRALRISEIKPQMIWASPESPEIPIPFRRLSNVTDLALKLRCRRRRQCRGSMRTSTPGLGLHGTIMVSTRLMIYLSLKILTDTISATPSQNVRISTGTSQTIMRYCIGSVEGDTQRCVLCCLEICFLCCA